MPSKAEEEEEEAVRRVRVGEWLQQRERGGRPRVAEERRSSRRRSEAAGWGGGEAKSAWRWLRGLRCHGCCRVEGENVRHSEWGMLGIQSGRVVHSSCLYFMTPLAANGFEEAIPARLSWGLSTCFL
ncbi:hypothetical protein AMTR_s00003p00192120 [Amborella trichopoda]|uniref:Uncharacterized protein n=1 Tax=Amborella trichopoda TaxID=13333 RepID=W1P5R7_AMBTC|nr:hypothetical protein AMTR_s00003p00192120 [Amborella trichopoda]